ncbi:MAG: ABC transporter permease [Ginsengibacter sp.]
MQLKDSLALAWRTIQSNKLRTGITVSIIGFGIMALIGIITAIASMNQSVSESFATMGANSFSIRFNDLRINRGRNEVKKTSTSSLKSRKSNERKIISYREAKLFKERYNFPARVSISISGPGSVVVSNQTTKTNPNISVIGADENYLAQSGYTLIGGRNFNAIDVESGRNICILGNSVAKSLYGDNTERALDKIIKVGGIKYHVVGILKDKGSSSFLNADNIVITSYNNIRRLFSTEGNTYRIGVMVNNIVEMEPAISEAIGTFRPIRNIGIGEENNFYISKSDSVAEILKSSLGAITTAAAFIGLITLFGAAIGLMNIMLVAVNERTREIGLVKAIGGKSRSIRTQFLFESVFISLIGAVIGIVLGVIVGNVVGIFLNTGFVVPWLWAFLGIIVCSAVGLFAGLYPAVKAASLDPIVALRYE